MMPLEGWLTAETNGARYRIKNTAAVHGHRLACLLDEPPREGLRSTYQQPSDLEKYGWTYTSKPVDDEELEGLSLTDIFLYPDISERPLDWVHLEVIHPENCQPQGVAGVRYLKTVAMPSTTTWSTSRTELGWR